MKKYRHKRTGEIAEFERKRDDGISVFLGEKGLFFVTEDELHEWEPHDGD